MTETAASDRRGVLTGATIGALGGLAFIQASAEPLPQVAETVVRAAGLAVFAFALSTIALARRDLPPYASTRRYPVGYWLVVAAEIALLIGGLIAFDAPVAWIALVAGLHFLALASIFHSTRQATIGVVLTAGGALGLLVPVAVVIPGFVLLLVEALAVARPVVAYDRPRSLSV